MNNFPSLSDFNATDNSSADIPILFQCPTKTLPLASWESSSYNTAAKVSTLLAVTVNVFTMPFTVFFNAVILLVVWKNISLQVERVVVLAYLALTDVLVGLVCQPLFIVRGVLQLKTSDQNCNMNTAYFFSVFLLVTAASHQLVLVTYERYAAIIHPFQYSTRITVKRLTYITIVLWALNTPVAILYFVLLAVGVPVWYIDIIYVVTATSFTMLMVYWYVRIIAAIRKQTHQVGEQQQNHANNTLQNNKAAITAGLLLGCFLASIIPLIFSFSLKQVLRFRSSASLFLSLRPWVLTVVHLGSFVNPIIYALRMRELREKCLQLLRLNTNISPQ